nr:hypothetical protein [Rhizobiaceae bacterium]
GNINNSNLLSIALGVNAGAVANSGTGASAGTIASLTNTGGTFANSGTVTTGTSITGGTVSNTGTLNAITIGTNGTLLNAGIGGSAINAGTLTNTGTLGNVDNSGTFTNGSNATAGSLVANTGSVINAGTLGSAINLAGGSLVNYGGTIGNVDNAAGATFSNLSGDAGVVTNAGTGSNAGSVQTLVNTGGTFANSGQIQNGLGISGGAVSNTGTVQGGTTITGGSLTNNGGSVENVTNSAIFNNLNGGVAAAIINSGTYTSTNSSATSLINSGSALFSSTNIVNSLNNQTGGTATLAANATLTGSQTLTNNGTLIIGGTVPMTASSALSAASSGLVHLNYAGGITNGAGGVLALANNVAATQMVATAGGSGFTNNGTIDLQDGATGDQFVVNGNFNNGTGANSGTFLLDANLNSGQPASFDTVDINGILTGTINVTFTATSGNGLYDTPGDTIIFTTDGDVTATSTIGTICGLPNAAEGQTCISAQEATGSFIINEFVANGNDYVVRTSLNLGAVGGIVGSLTTAQSLIDTTVSRTGAGSQASLTEPEADTCSPGTYTRLTGGVAEASALSTSSFSDDAEAEVRVEYGGFQVGADWGCFNIGGTGATFNFGLLGGYNFGTATQDQLLERLNKRVQSNNEFESFYAGVYGTYTSGPFFADMQVVHDWVNFEIDSKVDGAEFLEEPTFDARRLSVSASAGYTAFVDDISITPVVGLSYSKTTADTLKIKDNAGGGQLIFEDPESIVGFASVNVGRSFLLSSETAVLKPFVSATVYNDFAADPVTTYVTAGGNATPIVTENVGTYGELSVGLTYFSLVGDGEGRLKEINASLRGDVTFSDKMIGGRLTGALRLQF